MGKRGVPKGTSTNKHISLCLNCATELKECRWLMTGKVKNTGQVTEIQFRHGRNYDHGEMVYVTKECPKFTPITPKKVKVRPFMPVIKPGDLEAAKQPVDGYCGKMKWTPAADTKMVTLYEAGYPPQKIAEIMGRTTPAIYQRITTLGLRREN